MVTSVTSDFLDIWTAGDLLSGLRVYRAKRPHGMIEVAIPSKEHGPVSAMISEQDARELHAWLSNTLAARATIVPGEW